MTELTKNVALGQLFVEKIERNNSTIVLMGIKSHRSKVASTVSQFFTVVDRPASRLY